ncbi:hypothetical protein K0M31_008410 [Melipona bicolor]|uniref:Uncharacterized protein n=1 Tax=Melipona bicolor TaxID=60889 RepID=A0AA40KKF4_9HYME|nr:hypothetical protein K0M31_008410 [Melipona bicolor]
MAKRDGESSPIAQVYNRNFGNSKIRKFENTSREISQWQLKNFSELRNLRRIARFGVSPLISRQIRLTACSSTFVENRPLFIPPILCPFVRDRDRSERTSGPGSLFSSSVLNDA